MGLVSSIIAVPAAAVVQHPASTHYIQMRGCRQKPSCLPRVLSIQCCGSKYQAILMPARLRAFPAQAPSLQLLNTWGFARVFVYSMAWRVVGLQMQILCLVICRAALVRIQLDHPVELATGYS